MVKVFDAYNRLISNDILIAVSCYCLVESVQISGIDNLFFMFISQYTIPVALERKPSTPQVTLNCPLDRDENLRCVCFLVQVCMAQV